MPLISLLCFYPIVTHFDSQCLSVDTKEFCRFVDLKVEVAERFFDVLFFDIDQSHSA